MISATEFKKQINKTFSENMKSLDFKGSGFNYLMETDNFIFAFGIQANNHGNYCYAELGIQPKEIPLVIDGLTVDPKKVKYYNCEFRARIGGQWKYSENEEDNKNTVSKIFHKLQPAVNLFQTNPKILESIEVEDLNDFKKISHKLMGYDFMTGNIRFAWALARIWETKNKNMSKLFADYALSNVPGDSFSKIEDLKRMSS